MNFSTLLGLCILLCALLSTLVMLIIVFYFRFYCRKRAEFLQALGCTDIPRHTVLLSIYVITTALTTGGMLAFFFPLFHEFFP
jgi:hypothetical protein